MKVQLLLIAAALWLFVKAAYTDDQMQQLSARSPVIHLLEENYDKFLYGDRDYHLIVYMASDDPLVNCLLCREIHPHFTVVGKSWKHFHPYGWSEEEMEDGQRKNVYFLEADFVETKKLFQIMQLDSIPKIFHFPPTEPGDKSNAWVTENLEYQFFQGDHTAFIAQWILEVTGFHVELYTPPDYMKIAVNALITFAVVTALRRFSKQVSAVLRSTFVWGTLTLVGLLLFISGYMFNQIRNTPFVKESENGAVEYFQPTQQNQYGLETQIVSSMYALLGLSFVLLVNKVGTIRNPKVQFFAVLAMTFLIYATYSLYVLFFTYKARGYPYPLFEFAKF